LAQSDTFSEAMEKIKEAVKEMTQEEFELFEVC
jgi:predicted RNase H-like HicB family nuclease